MAEASESIDPAQIAARYTAVWGEPDAHLRRAAITELWASGGVEFVEGAQFRGHEELDARITHAHAEFVGSGKYTVAHADDATRHGDIVMFTVQLISTADGEIAWAARVFLLLDGNGRIREDCQLTVQPMPA
ncbi:hypothetical protein AB0L41_47795 [Amycolatopsis mediterranei]|uniref:hypothetical protein n=1 Tax=Amycolatopsis mediterranei TaxID=33910 RepID=UPI00341CB9B5